MADLDKIFFKKSHSSCFNKLFDEFLAKQREDALNKPTVCKRCKKKFKFSEMQTAKVSWDTGHYCLTCFDHFKREHTYTCPFCDTVFLSKKPSTACPLCRIKDVQKESLVVQRHINDARNAKRPATLKTDEWMMTLQDFGGYCAYCLEQPYEVLEHFIPLNPGKREGGGTTVDNCVPACESCNKKKGKVFPDEMLREGVIARESGTLGEYHYSIEMKVIERVWAYLDGKRPQPIPGMSLEERKQYHYTSWLYGEENKNQR